MFGKGKQRRHAMKLQSAMEYLMTYGWAILIIAVVLGALFSLGVFGNLLGNHCVTTPGWSCISATLSTTGILTMDIGQATGTAVNFEDAACSSVANSAGYPAYGPLEPNDIGNATSPTTGVVFTPSSVSNGQTFTLTVPCYTSDSMSPAPGSASAYTLGQAFTGYVWVKYTINGGSPVIAQITTSLTEKAS
jgi:hypothetical protein